MKKKVIHVLTDKNFGGAGRWVLNYLRYHDRDNYEVKVLLPKGSILVPRVEAEGVTVIEMEAMSDQSLDKKALRPMLKLFKEEKPDVVHTHASLTARLGAKLAGVKKIILTKHCMDQPATGMKKEIKKIINKTLSHQLIAISKAVEEELYQSGLTGKEVTLIYNGIIPLQPSKEEEKQALRQKLGIPVEHQVIGQIGRLEEVKGADLFLQAAIDVVKSKDHVTVLMIGTGSLEESMKAQVKEEGLEGRILFTGYLENVEPYLNIMDLNVMASRSEALCLSIIEGMSLGIPAVGTDAGGIREVIIQGKTGELVPCQDVEAMSKTIKKILKEDTKLQSYGEEGLKHVEANFTAKKMAAQVEALYQIDKLS